MKPSEATELLGKLAAYYPATSAPADTLTLFAAELAPDYEPMILAMALRKVVKQCKFFPSLAEIVEVCDECASEHYRIKRRLAQAEADADGARTAVSSGFSVDVLRIQKRFLSKSQNVKIVSEDTLQGEPWVAYETFCGRAIPRDLTPAAEQAWIAAVRDEVAKKRDDRLRYTESVEADAKRDLDKFLGMAVPSIGLPAGCSQ